MLKSSLKEIAAAITGVFKMRDNFKCDGPIWKALIAIAKQELKKRRGPTSAVCMDPLLR